MFISPIRLEVASPTFEGSRDVVAERIVVPPSRALQSLPDAGAEARGHLSRRKPKTVNQGEKAKTLGDIT